MENTDFDNIDITDPNYLLDDITKNDYIDISESDYTLTLNLVDSIRATIEFIEKVQSKFGNNIYHSKNIYDYYIKFNVLSGEERDNVLDILQKNINDYLNDPNNIHNKNIVKPLDNINCKDNEFIPTLESVIRNNRKK